MEGNGQTPDFRRAYLQVTLGFGISPKNREVTRGVSSRVLDPYTSLHTHTHTHMYLHTNKEQPSCTAEENE